jgi:hypothetical protein
MLRIEGPAQAQSSGGADADEFKDLSPLLLGYLEQFEYDGMQLLADSSVRAIASSGFREQRDHL